MWRIFVVMALVIINHQGADADVCKSDTSDELAGTIRQFIDPSQDPCDSFFLFACGGYLKNQNLTNIITKMDNTILEHLKTEITTTIEGQPPVLQKAKDFYKSCLDTTAIEKAGLKDIKESLQTLGGWPVLYKKWTEDSFNWTTTLKKIAEYGFGYRMILGITVGAYAKDNRKAVIQLNQPKFGKDVGIVRHSLLEGESNPQFKAYFKGMVQAAVLFGAKKTEAEKQLKESLEFEKKLAKICEPEENLRDVALVWKFMKISELQAKYPAFEWLDLFQSLLGEFATVSSRDLVQVISPSFIAKLGPLLKETPKRVLANYMLWQVVYSSSRSLNRRMMRISNNIDDALYGKSGAMERAELCVWETRNLMQPILAAAYVRKYFSPESKQKAKDLLELSRKQLIKIVKKVDWLDSATRKRAVKKIESIRGLIGYPEELTDDAFLDEFYSDLNVTDKNIYFKNTLAIARFNRRNEISELNKPFNVSGWGNQEIDEVTQVNSYYNEASNTVAFLSGILQGYMFDQERPDIFNLITLGQGLGHDLIFSITEQGGEYNELGNLKDWWKKGTKAIFRKKVDALGDEYSTYLVKEINVTLNGRNIQDQALADQGGVKVARLLLEELLDGLKEEPKLVGLEKYSTPQLFWIGSAIPSCQEYSPETLKYLVEEDEHPPPEFSINGQNRNLDEFAKDFQCPVGSYMNPKQKVTVW